jgi:transcriptional regulator GlxA family with amidase domain
MSARGRSVTVSKTATRFGFRELGRFSVEYRTIFGESPSETLRQAVHCHSRPKSLSVK